ncbi:hypothetical protein [Streptomyces sp. NBC_00140]|uniref:hypothetical protein n=1 Tax=Streptomyces sp. NBC_00140 TaxID=2975664 RepID=UPI0022536F65|nr:hypothetical protein [Streptomyces sp. NBC_00140]MCX5335486.1 hypothetical protein [Streptomyces sp. NBC_00140]MCX5338334.1 hypothetical protein [Streptomyces sp. NBC_00140]
MTRTGPQRYPGASTAHWYQDDFGGSPMEVNVVVLHTTEGRNLPDYGGGATAPNLTAVPDLAAKKLRWYQHFDIETSSRALVNLRGGAETNTLNACQVELVGTCDPATHAKWARAGQQHIYWPEAPDWVLVELAAFLRWMHEQHDVPLTGPKEWPAYPSSYGATSARMTTAEWTAFTGICGHLHVVENDHGDPGAIDFPKLIALTKGSTVPEEDDVALTDADIEKIARKVLTLDGVIVNATGDPANTHIALASAARNIETVVRRTEKAVAALPAVELTDTQIATLASAVAGNAALAELIAEKVAVKLAERLAQ